ncbi:Glycosyltransferase, GT2 family [Pseudobutyrivibrio ruminis]|uniref:Glycosyltransferase, GT2 family n=2 Tax=Pseudobutyrivibrio ruminis TaxID=46206 RepID=A0A1H7H6W1_9FIRM|nr:Glycosyltransferase, GT2 family [Pseudobutyrivibrio ruminis]
MNLKYAVVIVTYNRLELLKECLSAVLNQTYAFNDIYIVNNCSTDGTTAFLAEVNQDNVHVFNMDKNIGGAGGFSYGLSQVSDQNDYVLVIDDDAILSNDYIEKINEQVENGILAYSGSVCRDGEIDLSHRRRISDNVYLSDEYVSRTEYDNDSFLYDVSSFCGLVISVPLIKKIGLPRSEFFIWYDDSEYSLRIKKHSKIKNVNKAILNHKTKDNPVNGFTWKAYYGYRNFIEIGRCYSEKPNLFLIKRYQYHVKGMIKQWIKSLIRKDRGYYYKNCCRLHKEVIKTALKREFEMSAIFYPGANLEEKIVEKKY